MALGFEYSKKKLKPGPLGEIRLVHRAVLPILKPGTRCFELEEVTAGGFTLLLRAVDPHRGPRDERVEFPDF